MSEAVQQGDLENRVLGLLENEKAKAAEWIAALEEGKAAGVPAATREWAAMAQDAPDLSKLGEPPAHGEIAEGAADAKVTIIEYASASCPHCAAFYTDVYPALKKDYIDTGKVRFLQLDVDDSHGDLYFDVNQQ